MAAQAPARRPRSALYGREQPYGWAWIVSVVVHGGLFGALALGSLLQSCEPRLDPNQKPIAAKLVRLGEPRPKEWLPRKPAAPEVAPVAKEAPLVTPGEKVAPEPPRPDAAPKPETKVAEASKPAPAAAAPSSAAAAPKDAKVDPRKRLDEILKRHRGAAIAGPAEELPGQRDGDPEGDAEEAAEGERYMALLQKRIRDNYNLPSTISERERMYLSAVVRIFVEPNGRMTRWQLVESSGNSHFDSALAPALEKASPYPPPPEHMVAMMRRGLDVRFKP